MTKILAVATMTLLLLGCASNPPADNGAKAREEQELRQHSQEKQGDLDRAVDKQQ